MAEAFLVGGVRTPVGRYGGALANVRPDDLAAIVLRALVERTGIAADVIDEVILGSANQAGEDNRNVARMATLLAGLPDSLPGYTVNRLCASGMTAVANASQAIRAGEAEQGVGQAWRAVRHLHRVALHQPRVLEARKGHVLDAGNRRGSRTRR